MVENDNEHNKSEVNKLYQTPYIPLKRKIKKKQNINEVDLNPTQVMVLENYLCLSISAQSAAYYEIRNVLYSYTSIHPMT